MDTLRFLDGDARASRLHAAVTPGRPFILCVVDLDRPVRSFDRDEACDIDVAGTSRDEGGCASGNECMTHGGF